VDTPGFCIKKKESAVIYEILLHFVYMLMHDEFGNEASAITFIPTFSEGYKNDEACALSLCSLLRNCISIYIIFVKRNLQVNDIYYF